MNDTIRVGVIGAGANTIKHHIPKLQAIDGVEVVSVCNRSRESSQRVADQFDILTIYDNWWDLIAASDTNAIVIGTWPYMHCQLVLAALAADKHVMVEARMAMNADEARQMLAAAQARPQLITQIVPSPFSFGVDATIKRLTAEGYLGDILAIELRDHSGGFLDTDGPLHWRHNFDLSGFNIMTMGIWYETLIRWVGDATAVVARGQTYVKMRRDPQSNQLKAVRIPEHITILADMACGAQATISVSQVTGLMPSREAALYGSQGTLRFADGKLYGGQRGDKALQEIEVPAEEQSSWRVEEEFVGAIRGQEVIRFTSFEAGVKYMEFTEAVTRSLTEGCIISLPL